MLGSPLSRILYLPPRQTKRHFEVSRFATFPRTKVRNIHKKKKKNLDRLFLEVCILVIILIRLERKCT
jgi:hypothetical protein